jgi:hypothetical protein
MKNYMSFYLSFIHFIFRACLKKRIDVCYIVVANDSYLGRGKDKKVIPIHVAKAFRGGGGIAALILNLGVRWR